MQRAAALRASGVLFTVCILLLWAICEVEGGSDVPADWQANSASPISINLTSSLYEVSDQFLSITIDADAIRYNWDNVNFSMPRMINLAKGLSPAMLRVGGTYQDFLLFGSGGEGKKEQMTHSTRQRTPSLNNFTMSPAQWDAVNEFVKAVEWDFIFGLNLLLRHNWPNGSWDSSNAEDLLDYTASKGYVVNWELGNGTELYSYNNASK